MAAYRAASAIQVGSRRLAPSQGRDLMELIIELPEAAFDEVYGGVHFSGHTDSSRPSIRQNARGGDSVAVGGDGGDAFVAGTGPATGGAGGAATAGAGGAGGTNTIDF
jgi:hypothetical protein